jgi:integrase
MRLAAQSVTFANVPLRLLRHSHIEEWIKHLQSVPHGLRAGTNGPAPSTIRQRYRNVRSVLRGAVRDKVIAADPSDGVRLPRTRRAEAAMQLPAAAQVRAVIDASDCQFRVFVMLCAFAGLRLGEAAGLQVGDIDVAARTITVRRQVQRASGPAVVISPPKHGSERTVYLADGVLDPYERICFGYLTGTSQGGCSLASPVRTRYIRTASATCGARRGQPPDCPRSGCTTFGTSTPRD